MQGIFIFLSLRWRASESLHEGLQFTSFRFHLNSKFAIWIANLEFRWNRNTKKIEQKLRLLPDDPKMSWLRLLITHLLHRQVRHVQVNGLLYHNNRVIQHLSFGWEVVLLDEELHWFHLVVAVDLQYICIGRQTTGVQFMVGCGKKQLPVGIVKLCTLETADNRNLSVSNWNP